MNLKPLTHASSKQEEKEFLGKVASLTSDLHTYLSSLFTPKLIEWAGKQIDQELCPDLYGAYQHTLKCLNEANQSLSNERNQWAAEAKSWKQEIDLRREQIQHLNACIHSANEEHQRDFASYREVFETTHDENTKFFNENLRLTEEVAILKLIIFDMEHPAIKREDVF
jgi:hypothetical protein